MSHLVAVEHEGQQAGRSPELASKLWAHLSWEPLEVARFEVEPATTTFQNGFAKPGFAQNTTAEVIHTKFPVRKRCSRELRFGALHGPLRLPLS